MTARLRAVNACALGTSWLSRAVRRRSRTGPGEEFAMAAGPSSTIDPQEVARFERLAETWWDPRGPMRVLHRFNPIRLAFIRDEACRRFGRDPRTARSLEGLAVLDVGCGG